MDDDAEKLEAEQKSSPLPVSLPLGKFRGVLEELQNLYKVVNGSGSKSIEQRVEAAFAFLNLGMNFLDEYGGDEKISALMNAIDKEMGEHAYPKLRRSVAVTSDKMPVIRFELVQTPGKVGGLIQDVLPTYASQGETFIVHELLHEFYNHYLQRWCQAVAYELMKKNVLRRESRTVHRFSQVFGRDGETKHESYDKLYDADGEDDTDDADGADGEIEESDA